MACLAILLHNLSPHPLWSTSWSGASTLYSIHFSTQSVSYLMQKVQSVQNAAARLITGTRQYEHITPVLQKLHWLRVRQRVEFKLTCLVHQSLAEQIPSYLASDIQLTTNTGSLQLRFRSAPERICHSMHTQQLRRQKFFCCRSSCVERLAIISAAGHELQPLQACTERTYVTSSHKMRLKSQYPKLRKWCLGVVIIVGIIIFLGFYQFLIL